MNRKIMKKLVVGTLCALFIAGALFAAMFASVCLNHQHDCNGPGGSCAVCAQLTASWNFLMGLKLLSAALVSAAVSLGFPAAGHAVLRTVAFRADSTALVRLKIRLNN